MSTNQIRKTHPMVLVAAAALTIFSILGSAAITGLIPSAYSEHSDAVAPKASSEQDNSKLINESSINHQNNVSGKISENTALGTDISICQSCGKIVSIKQVKTDGNASGLGAVAGGVTGGVIGNQIGKGQGNVLMTILGAGGGAYAGHTIEKKVNAKTAYVIKVKMENGDYRTVTQNYPPTYAVGDAVKLKKGQLINA